jgi:putative transcriptional regulator
MRFVRRLAAIVGAFCFFSAVLPGLAERTARPSLAGQLLVASPSMGDPRFDRTVVLMVRHDADGAFGLVINRPAGLHPITDLLRILGDKESAPAGDVRIFAGGPVQPEILFILHSAEYARPQTTAIDARFAVTSSREVVRDIGAGRGPNKSLIVFGYAGWGPGQLENELDLRAWSIAPADPGLVFDEDRAKVWERAYAQRVQDL